MRAVSDWAGVAPATTPASVASSLIAAGPYSLASARSSAVALLGVPFFVRQSCYRPRSSNTYSTSIYFRLPVSDAQAQHISQFRGNFKAVQRPVLSTWEKSTIDRAEPLAAPCVDFACGRVPGNCITHG